MTRAEAEAVVKRILGLPSLERARLASLRERLVQDQLLDDDSAERLVGRLEVTSRGLDLRADAAALLAAHGTISAQTAAVGSVIGTAVSVIVNVLFTARISKDTGLTKHLAWTLGSIAALGLLGVIVQDTLIAIINRF